MTRQSGRPCDFSWLQSLLAAVLSSIGPMRKRYHVALGAEIGLLHHGPVIGEQARIFLLHVGEGRERLGLVLLRADLHDIFGRRGGGAALPQRSAGQRLRWLRLGRAAAGCRSGGLLRRRSAAGGAARGRAAARRQAAASAARARRRRRPPRRRAPAASRPSRRGARRMRLHLARTAVRHRCVVDRGHGNGLAPPTA